MNNLAHALTDDGRLDEGVSPLQSSPLKMPQRWSSAALFVNTTEVLITHGSEVYRLHITKQNKLILTK